MKKLFAIALLGCLAGCGGMNTHHAVDAQAAGIMQNNTDQVGYDEWMRTSASGRLLALQMNLHKIGLTACGEGTAHDTCDVFAQELNY